MLAQGSSAQDGGMRPKGTGPVHPSMVLHMAREPEPEGEVVDLSLWEQARVEHKSAAQDSRLPTESGMPTRSPWPDQVSASNANLRRARHTRKQVTILAEEQRARVLRLLTEKVVNKANVGHGTVAVDLGCGNGQLALALARCGAKVIASDNRPVMVELLEARAALAKLRNVAGVVCEPSELDFETGSIDLVVSSNALHYLRDRQKQPLVQAVARWLRPGGQLVIGDLVQLPEQSQDSGAPTVYPVGLPANRPPDGSRLARAASWPARSLRGGPVTVETWLRILSSAGFVDLAADPLPFGTAVISGTMPHRLRPWVPQRPA
jgi:SAM-dependent methyltransferase